MNKVYIASRVIVRDYGSDFTADMKAFDTMEKAETYLKELGMTPVWRGTAAWPHSDVEWNCDWAEDMRGYIDELTVG